MATAKHRAIDTFRRGKVLEKKREELGREIEIQSQGAQRDLTAEVDDDIGDDLLSLIFTACHPVLSTRTAPAGTSC